VLERLCRIYPFEDKTQEIWKRAISERRVKEETYDGVSLFRLDKDVHGLKRGTILAEDGVIMAYPRIMRVLHLENGVKRNLKGPFYVEEKVDGYNIRIAKVDGRVLAFSRGGFICPFSTDRVEDFIDMRFFNVHPGLVLCCEVAGPENPYNPEWPPYIKDDIRFFVFDIMEKGREGFIPSDERYGLIEVYGLPGVRVFGSFLPEDWERVKGIVKGLDGEGCEGVVMKPQERKKTLKYVTPFAHMRDLRLGSLVVGELPGGYYLKRVVMLGLSIREMGLVEDLKGLGEAFLNPILEAQARVERGEGIKETFTIKVKREENIDRLLKHLKAAPVDINLILKEREGDYWKVVFTRGYRRAEAFIKAGLKGSTFMD